MSPALETSVDLFLDGRVKIKQPLEGYRAATDPVFLAACLNAKPGSSVLDVGAGVGTASFCLAARRPDLQITGIELQPELVALAHDNITINAFETAVRFVEGDILARPMDPVPNSFDQVMTNPPFYPENSGHRPPNEIKARANMEKDGTLAQWMEYCLRMTKPKGTLTMINRMERLEDTLVCLGGRLGEIVIYPLWPLDPFGDEARPAKRFILQGRKGIKTPMRFAPGLIIHDGARNYTQKAKAVLKNADSIDLRG